MTSASAAGRGYADPAYVAALSEFGTPVHLPRSRGYLLERPIEGTGARDLLGAYPLFSCQNWSELDADLVDVRGAVSVVLVADPLDGVHIDRLGELFSDHVVLFKRHWVRDLTMPSPLPSHHRRHLRRAARAVDVDISYGALGYLDDWIGLYAGLVARHRLTGIRAFSRESFRQQLTVPGMVAVRAERDGATAAMTLWLVSGENGYYHLGASSKAGREVSASYALFAAAVDHLHDRGVRYVDFGGVAGSAPTEGGLSRFKRGWATHELPAYLCGRILDQPAYASLSAAVRHPRGWFPAYREADPDVAVSAEIAVEK